MKKEEKIQRNEKNKTFRDKNRTKYNKKIILHLLNFILVIALFFAAFQFSFAEPVIYIEKSEYLIGEEITIEILDNKEDYGLRIIGDNENFRYQNLLIDPVLFIADTAGNYIVELYDKNTGETVIESSFSVLTEERPIFSSDYSEDNLFFSKNNYELGEKIIISILTELDGLNLYIRHKGEMLRFLGDDESSISYIPREIGKYDVILQNFAGEYVSIKSFNVYEVGKIPGTKGGENAVIKNNTNSSNQKNAIEIIGSIGNIKKNNTEFNFSNSNLSNNTNKSQKNLPFENNLAHSNLQNNLQTNPEELVDLEDADSGEESETEKSEKIRLFKQIPKKELNFKLKYRNNEKIEGFFLFENDDLNHTEVFNDSIKNITPGNYKTTIIPKNTFIKKIEYNDLSLNFDFEVGLEIFDDAKVDRQNIEGKKSLRGYNINSQKLSFQSGYLTATAVGTELYECSSMNLNGDCDVPWKKVRNIYPGELYDIPIPKGQTNYAETGVATVNSIKPIYYTNESVELVMIILTKEGYLTSNAVVDLKITDPSGQFETFSSSTGEIRKKGNGIFYINYNETEIQGNYSLLVTAVGPDVDSNLTNNFLVQEYYEFDINRNTPFVIDPFNGTYDSSVQVISHIDGVEVFDYVEIVPGDYQIYNTTGNVSRSGRDIHIRFENVNNGSNISYTFQAPYETPDLDYVIGRIEYNDAVGGGNGGATRVFNEARPWYIGVDPQGTNAYFVYRDTDAVGFVKYRIWNGTDNNLEAEQIGPDFGAAIAWMDIECMEERPDCIVAANQIGNTMDLAIYYEINNTWSGVTNLATVDDDYKQFDIACEDSSGDCLIVYETSTGANNQFSYRTYSTDGTLSGATAVTVTPAINSEFRWIELNPQEGTDEIAIVLQNEQSGGGEIIGGIWDGGSFGDWQEFYNDAPANGYRNFGCAYEGQSNELICFYGRDANDGMWAYEWDGTTWTDLGQVWTAGDLGAETRNIRACGEDPYTGPIEHDKLIVTSSDQDADGDGTYWNGTALVTASAPTQDSSNERVRDHTKKCSWEHGGATAVIVWVDANQLVPEWGTFTNSTNAFSYSAWSGGSTTGMPTWNDDVESIELDLNPVSDQMLITGHGRTTGGANPANGQCTRWTGSTFSATNCGQIESTLNTDASGAREFFGLIDVAWSRFNEENAPNITLTWPANDTIQADSNINFSWNATDDWDASMLCNITIDGVLNQTNISSLNMQLTNFSVDITQDGDHTWYVTCVDDYENVGTSETFHFAIPGPANITIVSIENDTTETYIFTDQEPEVNASVNFNSTCYLSEVDETYSQMVSNGRVNCGSYERNVAKVCEYTNTLSLGTQTLHMACSTIYGDDNNQSNNNDMDIDVHCDSHSDCTASQYCNTIGDCGTDVIAGFSCLGLSFSGNPDDEVCQTGAGSTSVCVNDSTYSYTGYYCTSDSDDCVYNNGGNSSDLNFYLCNSTSNDYYACGAGNNWTNFTDCGDLNDPFDQSATQANHTGDSCGYYATAQACDSGDNDEGTYGCNGTATDCGSYIYLGSGSCGSNVTHCDVGCGGSCDLDNATTATIVSGTCFYDRSCNNACSFSENSQLAPDFCINDSDGGSCAYDNRTHPVVAETCYYNPTCSNSTGAGMGSSGTLRADFCDYCDASGNQNGGYAGAPNASCSSSCANSGIIQYDSVGTPTNRSDDCLDGTSSIVNDTLTIGDIWTGSGAATCDNTECDLDCGTLVGTCNGGVCECEDNDNPELNIFEPSNNSWDNDGLVNFSYNVSDLSSIIENCSLYINGTLNQTNSSIDEAQSRQNFTLDLENGLFNWNITCYDNTTNNNSNTSFWRVIGVDTTDPVLSNPNIDGNNFSVNDVVCLNVTVSDTFSDVSSVTATIRLPSGGNDVRPLSDSSTTSCDSTNGDGVYSLEYTIVFSGDFNWTVATGEDNAGNSDFINPGLNWTVAEGGILNASMLSPTANFEINESEFYFTYNQTCSVNCSGTIDCENVYLIAEFNDSSGFLDINTTSNELYNDENNFSCGNLSAEIDWFNTTFESRRMIDVDSSAISSTLSNFPVLIRLNSSNFNFSKAQTNGEDLRFTDSSGTVLVHQVENYNSGSEIADVWVRVPVIDSDENTTIVMYYNNTAAPRVENITGVWDSDFISVLHMNNQSDSTSLSNDLNCGTCPDATTGQIDGAYNFDGTSESFTITNDADINTGGPWDDKTISLWFNASSYATGTNKNMIYEQGGGSRGLNIYINDTSLYAGGWNIPSESGWSGTWLNTTINTDTWYHAALVLINGTDAQCDVCFITYINGVQYGIGDGRRLYAHGGDIQVGFGVTLMHDGSAGETRFAGNVDELRLSNSPRSASWILAEYHSGAGSLLSVSSSEQNLTNFTDNSSCTHTFNITANNSGNNTFPIRCEAVSNNSATSLSDTVDAIINDHPAASFFTPLNGTWLNGVVVLNASNSSDADGTIINYHFEYDDNMGFTSPTTICNGTSENCTFNTTTQSECTNNSLSCYIRVNVTDDDVLTNATTIIVGFDYDGPVSVLDQPVNFENISDNLVYVNATVTDDENGTISWVTFEYRVDDVSSWNTACVDSDGAAPFNCTWNVTLLSDGDSYQVRVFANDSYNNTGAADSHTNITIDRTEPSINLTLPLNETFTRDDNITFEYNVTDISDIASCELIFNDVLNETNTSISGVVNNFTINDIVEQNYTWYVNCTDVNGNENNSLAFNLYIDRTGPTAIIDEPDPNENITGSSFTLNGTLVDLVSNEDTVVFEYRENTSESWKSACNDTTITSNIASCSWDISSIPDGNQIEVRMYGNDTLGNNGSYHTRTGVTIDNNGPNITLISPNDFATDSDGNVSFNYNVDDVISNITNCSLFINNTLNQTTVSPAEATTLSFDIFNMTNGVYLWNITCWDDFSAGTHQGITSTRNLTIDIRFEMNITVIANESSYEVGDESAEFANISTNITAFFGDNLGDVNVTQDIVRVEVTNEEVPPWWNTAWESRKPIFVSNDLNIDRQNASVRVNITGLSGRLSEGCLFGFRVVDLNMSETMFNVIDTDNSTYCEITFAGNVSALASNENHYFVYYNNSQATSPNWGTIAQEQFSIFFEDFEGTGWVNITTEDPNQHCSGGSGTNFNNCVDYTTSHDFAQMFNAGTFTFSGQHVLVMDGVSPWVADRGIYYNFSTLDTCDGAVCEDIQVTGYVATGSIDNSNEFCRVWAREDSTTTYSELYNCQGSAPSCEFSGGGNDIPTAESHWQFFDQNLNSDLGMTLTSNMSVHIGAAVPGGSDQCFFEDINITGLRSGTANISASQGSQQLWIERRNNLTDANGAWSFILNVTNRTVSNYSAVSRGTKILYTPNYNFTFFELIPDSTGPDVTLTLPANNTTSNSSVTFAYQVHDELSSIANCSLIIDGVVEDTSFPPIIEDVNNFFYPRIPSGGPHNWSVNCTDVFGNEGASDTWIVIIIPPDLQSSTDNITMNVTFNITSPVEGQNVTINVTVFNDGGSDANNFSVEVYETYPRNRLLLANFTELNLTDVSGNNSNVTLNLTYIIPQGGPIRITVELDAPITTNGTLNELNESDNQHNRTFDVPGYQYYYGSVLANTVIGTGDNENLFLSISNFTNFTGNVIVVDADSSVNFAGAIPLGINTTNESTDNDFSELDELLNMTNFSDSINNVFANGSNTSLVQDSFVFYGQNITNVTIDNTTNSEDFVTGILWDTTDDDGDGEFSFEDAEDVIFISKVDYNNVGEFGTYDYEIKVPAFLRSYKGATDNVAIFVELE